MMAVDRIDAITELHSLGVEAEQMILLLDDARKSATNARLAGNLILAGWCNNDASMLEAWIADIGKRQQAIIDQLQAAGDIIFL